MKLEYIYEELEMTPFLLAWLRVVSYAESLGYDFKDAWLKLDTFVEWVHANDLTELPYSEICSIAYQGITKEEYEANKVFNDACRENKEYDKQKVILDIKASITKGNNTSTLISNAIGLNKSTVQYKLKKYQNIYWINSNPNRKTYQRKLYKVIP